MATQQIAEGALDPLTAFALVGAIGVGSQWLAWRLRMPAIVLMLAAGLIVGPMTGFLVPSRDFGVLLSPMISLAVAIILFEGGLTLNFHQLFDSEQGVKRLVYVGAPVGWLFSALAIHYAAGLSWATSIVFGGIMIVSGPTVIAPLLRQARLARRPATLLQWEAILNDPVGALASVFALGVVTVQLTATSAAGALVDFIFGVGLAIVLGLAGGWLIAWSFRRGIVPEYMKVPVLISIVLAVFALADYALHESGLLAVTVMGVYVANANLPSYAAMHRFKEQATILLVSGVFVLLAADLPRDVFTQLDWRVLVFLLAVVLMVRPATVRPATVLIALLGTNIPMNERILVALTAPRGVVLVAVSGVLGAKLLGLGVEDGAMVLTLAFALVAFTVVLNGFTLSPLAKALGLSVAEKPGVLIVGGSRWVANLGETLEAVDVPVLVADANHTHLRAARSNGLKIFSGDILSEQAERDVEFARYNTVLAASDNDPYNTLVATDLAPEFGHNRTFQVQRARDESRRHALPTTLGGRGFGVGFSYLDFDAHTREGWRFGKTALTEEFTIEDWQTKNPDAMLIARKSGENFNFLEKGAKTTFGPQDTLIYFAPPKAVDAALKSDQVKQAS